MAIKKKKSIPVINWNVHVEGNFLITASNKNVLFNRMNKIESWGFGNAEYDKSEGCEDVYKILCGGSFEDFKTLKLIFDAMCELNWFYNRDSYLLIDGKEIFSDGGWLHEKTTG